MKTERVVLAGRAYGRRATLEIAGDTLTWRAQRPTPENIVTTVHDVRRAAWLDLRVSRGGLALAALGAVWAATRELWPGLAALAAGVLLLAWRALAPRHYLVLDVGDRRLVLAIAGASADAAASLVDRIRRALASGEVPSTPPALP